MSDPTPTWGEQVNEYLDRHPTREAILALPERGASRSYGKLVSEEEVLAALSNHPSPEVASRDPLPGEYPNPILHPMSDPTRLLTMAGRQAVEDLSGPLAAAAIAAGVADVEWYVRRIEAEAMSMNEHPMSDPVRQWAPIGSLGNVLDILDEALAHGVTTHSTLPPGAEGVGGQAMTGWVHADRIQIARDRLAALSTTPAPNEYAGITNYPTPGDNEHPMSDPIREREHREEHADGWHWWRCVPVIDAALAPTPAPLDVDRLARALYIEQWGEWPPRDGMNSAFLAVLRRQAERLTALMR